LLGAIDALVAGSKTGANYHFAWFQALSLTTAGRDTQ
jgi:L-lactate permease